MKLTIFESLKLSRTIIRRINKPFHSQIRYIDSGLSSTNSSIDYHETESNDENEANIRDKSRLTPYLKKILNQEPTGLTLAYQYRIQYLRKYYGTHGQESKLNPGLCYPTPEELANRMEYESLAYPPFEEIMVKMKARKEAIAEQKRAREELIERNMKKLPIWRKEMLNREAKKQADMAQRLAKKEAVISEIREILGYNVNVNDPRFQEMLEKRDEEEKKKRKLAKKEKAKEKMLATLIGGAADDLKDSKKPEEEQGQDDEENEKHKKK